MESRENILDTEESYLSPANPELSLSSGVVSLPSANKLADLSLASNLTDSEAENEPTILTSRPCEGNRDSANDILYKENVKMFSDPLQSYMLPCSQRSLNSAEKKFTSETNPYSKSKEIPSSIVSKERCSHEGLVLDEEPSRDYCPGMKSSQCEAITNLPSLSLDAVRGTLQQNCNLLSDRHLLKDLLECLDERIEQEPEPHLSLQSPYSGSEPSINMTHEKCIDTELKETNNAPGILDKQLPSKPGTVSSLKNHASECSAYNNFDQVTPMLSKVEFLRKSLLDHHDAHTTSGLSQGHIHTPMFNSGPGGQEQVLQKLPSCGRHVKLQIPVVSTQDSLLDVEGEEYEGNKEHCSTLQSSEVLQKLAGLRWSLFGWADVRSSPPTDSTSSLTFLHHLLDSLQTLQLEKKHLKEELAGALERIKILSAQSYIRQHLHEKRKARLVEADRQLGELQHVWAATQEAGQQEIAKLRSHCHTLKEENASLNKEVECLKNEVVELKATSQQHEAVRTQAEKTQELLAASQKKVVEVLEENTRVNLSLEGNKKYLQELEEVKIPLLQRELEDVQTRTSHLENSNKQLCQEKTQLEEELNKLQEQYKIVREKILAEQEKTANAEQQKIVSEKELKGMSGKMETMKTKLHLHYQAQVEELVAKKSSALQEQLKTMESNLEKSVEEKLQAQEEGHQSAREKLKKRHQNEIINLKTSYESEMEKLYSEVEELRQENHRLQQQRQGVVSAVSSIFGLEHQMSSDPLMYGNSAKPVGGSSHSLNGVRDGPSTSGGHTISDRSTRKLPHFKFGTSSSSESGSSVFPEGRQTSRHLRDKPQQHPPGDDTTLENFHLKNQEKGFVVSSAYGKIRRASEILQATDLTDEDGYPHDDDRMLYNPLEDQKIARMLQELNMVNQISAGPQSEAPTHDTSLDQSPQPCTS